jgi:hypothetical protein
MWSLLTLATGSQDLAGRITHDHPRSAGSFRDDEEVSLDLVSRLPLDTGFVLRFDDPIRLCLSIPRQANRELIVRVEHPGVARRRREEDQRAERDHAGIAALCPTDDVGGFTRDTGLLAGEKSSMDFRTSRPLSSLPLSHRRRLLRECATACSAPQMSAFVVFSCPVCARPRPAAPPHSVRARIAPGQNVRPQT